MMTSLELHDIQAYVMQDYPDMMYSRYIMLRVDHGPSAKQWLNHKVDDIAIATPGGVVDPHQKTFLNIAFTSMGLIALGMHLDNVNAFSREFREGMTAAHRQRLLGDVDGGAPEQWNWGSEQSNAASLHVLLLAFGKNEEICLQYVQELKLDYEQNGLFEIKYIDGRTLENNKEHFGFRDGISQPIILGSGQPGLAETMVQPGEFILGYHNEYNVLPQSPLIQVDQGDQNLLAADAGGSGKKDLGRNGTYLVIRDLEQHVDKFWNYMNSKTQNEDGTINVDESIKLSAKMMGRWPSGAPVTIYPYSDPGIFIDDNNFGYSHQDKEGSKCPFGAHVRRANPRDNFEDLSPKESLKLSRRHRIIRRARLYGEPIIGSPINYTYTGAVGLLFNCFNADISRQFEFIQYAWANVSKIKQLYNDPDPIIGAKELLDAGVEQNFTIQDEPVNRTIKGLERFVTVKGGAYFFFPSISALRYLASIK